MYTLLLPAASHLSGCPLRYHHFPTLHLPFPLTLASFSRFTVNFMASAKTMLSNVIISCAILMVLAAVTPAFKVLPQAAISAIIINVVLLLVKMAARGGWRRRMEGWVGET